MTYRGDTDPLKVEETALASELTSLQRREREVTRALDATRAKLRNGRAFALPMLEDVRIASPCSASWEDMTGDARVRFCGKCAKNVYNLSEMTRDEGEALLAKNEGEMCVRLYKRKDGTVITTDCPVGVKKKRVGRAVALAAAAFGAAGALAGVSAMRSQTTAMGSALPIPELPRPTTGAVAFPTQVEESTDVTTRPPAFPPPGQTAPPSGGVPAGAHAIGGTIPAQRRRGVPHAMMGAPMLAPELSRSLP
jgi:hypothetical protein